MSSQAIPGLGSGSGAGLELRLGAVNEDSGLVEVYGLVDTHGHTHGH